MKKIAIRLLFIIFLPLSTFAKMPAHTEKQSENQKAIFAAGCFWCVESDLEKVHGVKNVISGYEGGVLPNPTYKLVSSGSTNYAEAVQVEFDPSIISYEKLLTYFWKNTDPTVKDQQFCDIGHQYRSEIFYLNDTQKKAAIASLDKVKQKFPEVYTGVSEATKFYPAEEYHQEYSKKNPKRYHFYRWNCGRDKRLKEIWGKS